jgi:hypothetical protein
LGLALPWVSFAVGESIVGLVFLATPVLGIVAWVWANRELRGVERRPTVGPPARLARVGRGLGIGALLMWPLVAAALAFVTYCRLMSALG